MDSTKICSIEGCERLAGDARGWCGMHYSRWKRHGDPLVKLRTGRPNSVSPNYVKSIGYRRIQRNGRRELEHRLVAEEKVGRLILPDEVVHHINEDRLDNRPENLAVMLRSEHQRMHHTQTHCRKGHELTSDNVMVAKTGARRCKTCNRDWVRRRRVEARSLAESSSAS